MTKIQHKSKKPASPRTAAEKAAANKSSAKKASAKKAADKKSSDKKAAVQIPAAKKTTTKIRQSRPILRKPLPKYCHPNIISIMPDLRSSHTVDESAAVPVSTPTPYFQNVTPTPLPIFSGLDDERGCENFLESARRTTQAFHMPATVAVEWILSFLQGTAREEVLGRPPSDRDHPEKVLKIIQETFGSNHNALERVRRFHTRKQQPSESILEYGQSLQQLASQANRTRPEAIPDWALKERLIDGVASTALKAHMREHRRQFPDASFLTLREEARRWTRENPEVDIDVVTAGQLEELRATVAALTAKLNEPSSQPRGYWQPSPSPDQQWQPPSQTYSRGQAGPDHYRQPPSRLYSRRHDEPSPNPDNYWQSSSQKYNRRQTESTIPANGPERHHQIPPHIDRQPSRQSYWQRVRCLWCSRPGHQETECRAKESYLRTNPPQQSHPSQTTGNQGNC